MQKKMNSIKFHNTLKEWLEISKLEDSATILWSAGYKDILGSFEGLLAVGEDRVETGLDSLEKTDSRLRILSLSYDAKNEIETSLASLNSDHFHRPNIELITPVKWEVLLRNGTILNSKEHEFNRDVISNLDQNEFLNQTELVKHWDGEVRMKCNRNDAEFAGSFSDVYLNDSLDVNRSFTNPKENSQRQYNSIDWNSRVTKEKYVETINWIKSKIVAGDFYELNYCISFEASVDIDPYWVFEVMTMVSGAPMMTFIKRGNYYLMSSSMERYLRSDGSWILSQPIKGTIRNSAGNDGVELKLLAETLHQSEKDRAENVMIVDLVRNDLSRICMPSTVKVSELCGIYAFPHVLQMISTVFGKKKEDLRLSDIIKATFPMGSMTGAPKIAVMQASEEIESFKRGLYSGSIGWVCGDSFDLNVVIRALQFDSNQNTLQYAVGGAITVDSDANEEYKECMDKAEAMLKTLCKAGYSISNL
jgi:anthranilate/para-aminobenzoate synthase component I